MVVETGSLDLLPTEMLVRILADLPFETRLTTIPLVCKAWAQLARTPSDLWRSCMIPGYRVVKHSKAFTTLGQKLPLRTLRQSVLVPATIGSSATLLGLGIIMAAVRMQALRRMFDLQVVQWLAARGSAIQEINIDANPVNRMSAWSHLRGTSTALLQQLPNLRQLVVSGSSSFMIAERHLPDVKAMPHLASLDLTLHSDHSWSDSTLEPLLCLGSLTALSLKVLGIHKPMLVSSLSMLTQLRELRLETDGSLSFVREADLWHTVSKLTGLSVLLLGGLVDHMPPELAALTLLQHLTLRGFDRQGPEFEVSSSIHRCSRLQHLTLESLPYTSNESWQTIWSLLQLLPLQQLKFGETDLSEVEPWTLSSQLTSLELIDCSVSYIPDAIRDLPMLQELCVIGDKLEGFPRGPYLRNLQRLEILCPHEFADARVLKAATKLKCVSIQYQDDKRPPWTRSHLEPILPKDCELDLLDEPEEWGYSEDELWS